MRTRTLGPADIHALTGLTPTAITAVVGALTVTHTMGRPRILPHTMRVLLCLVALRTNLTERALAAIFGTSQSTAHRIIRDLIPAVAALFTDGGGVRAGETLLLDGTLIPVHDQTLTKPSKNYRRSVNIQVLATTSRRIVHVGKAWPGNRNDIIVAKATVTLPEGVTTLTDGGYRSMPGATLPPPKTGETANAAHRKHRARIEHILARMKNWQMLRQCRRRGNNINHAARAVAYLYNLNYATDL